VVVSDSATVKAPDLQLRQEAHSPGLLIVYRLGAEATN